MKRERFIASVPAVAAVLAGGLCMAMAQGVPTPLQAAGDEPPSTPWRRAEQWGWFYPEQDPWAELRDMQQRLERIMADTYARFRQPAFMMPPSGTFGFYPDIDIRETDKDIVVVCDLPGMEKEKIDIEFREGNLIISGTRESVKEESGDEGWYVHERSVGSFERVIPIAAEIKEDAITADYKNGVLTVTLPKVAPSPRPAGRKIRVI